MTRVLLAGALGAALLSSTALVASPLTDAVVPAAVAAEPRTVTLVGDLQAELGCETDWDPACEATVLEPVEGSETAYWLFDFERGGALTWGSRPCASMGVV